jgi:hypothetical protein
MVSGGCLWPYLLALQLHLGRLMLALVPLTEAYSASTVKLERMRPILT